MADLYSMASGVMDDGFSPFVPGVNCVDCGRFIGRDGSIRCIERASTAEAVRRG